MGSAWADQAVTTDRLRLRPQRPEDVAAIAPWVGDFDVARMTTNIPHPYGPEAVAAYAELLATRDGSADLSLHVETHAGEVVGGVGAHRRDGPFPEIGYWIARPHWGRGYATEAAEALCDLAQALWGCRALTAGHFADNPASGRVLDKVGFLYTGVRERRASLARGEAAETRMMVRLG